MLLWFSSLCWFDSFCVFEVFSVCLFLVFVSGLGFLVCMVSWFVCVWFRGFSIVVVDFIRDSFLCYVISSLYIYNFLQFFCREFVGL